MLLVLNPFRGLTLHEASIKSFESKDLVNLILE